jgi:hypothetical protein
MIIRGTIQNGGVTFGRDGQEVMVRVWIDESIGVNGEGLSPGRLRGRSIVMVLSDEVQLPAAVMPADGDDAHPVDAGDDAHTVVESMNG